MTIAPNNTEASGGRVLRWRVADVFVVAVVYATLLAVYLYLFGQPGQADVNRHPWGFVGEELADSILLASLPIFVVVKVYGAGVDEIGLSLVGAWRKAIAGFGVGVGLSVFAYVHDKLLFATFGLIDVNPYVELFGASHTPAGISVILFSVLLLGPISEEIFFRGFAYTIFRKRYGVVPAALVTAAFFAAGHFSATSFILVLLSGLVLALLFQRTNTLVAPVVAHLTFNLVSFAEVLLSPIGPK